MPARNGRARAPRARGPLRKIILTFGCSPGGAGWEFRIGLERGRARNADEQYLPFTTDARSAFPDGERSETALHSFPGPRDCPQLALPTGPEAHVPRDDTELPPVSDENKIMPNFWDSLNTDQKRAFKAKSCKRVFPAGARLMREGDDGDHAAVILSGLTEIRVWENGAERVVAERGPGQLIGERAALEMNPRSATVVAMDTVVALVMRTADFAAFISTYPSVLKIVENQIYMRLVEGAARPERGPRSGRAASRGAGGGPPWPRILCGQNCTVVHTDVVAFASDERTDQDRKIIREAILAITRLALGPMWEIVRREDRGDGLLLIVPPSVPTAQVIERLVTVLPHELGQHNRMHSRPARIRLRVAVAVGPIEEDSLGVSGKAIIMTARLLDAPDFKAAIAGRDAVLGLIVSPFVYDGCVRPGGGHLDPACYASVPVRVKETSTVRGCG